MLEPAAYGAAVLFGPNTWNFKDIVAELLARDAAEVVRDGAELTAAVRRLLSEPDLATGRARRAREFVEMQQGATQRTVELIDAVWPGESAARHAA
jgi:3-deoxy-D-manno-octulosonic-acid transferase